MLQPGVWCRRTGSGMSTEQMDPQVNEPPPPADGDDGAGAPPMETEEIVPDEEPQP